jgi:hypothetical protein
MRHQASGGKQSAAGRGAWLTLALSVFTGLVALMPTVACAQAPAGIVVGQGVAGINLGESKQQVRQALGTPFRQEPTYWVFNKPCLCDVSFRHNSVSAIDIFSKSLHTDRGIAAGTSFEKTTEAYPEAKCYHPGVYGETSQYCVVRSTYKGHAVKTTFAFFDKDLGVRDIEIRFG